MKKVKRWKNKLDSSKIELEDGNRKLQDGKAKIEEADKNYKMVRLSTTRAKRNMKEAPES